MSQDLTTGLTPLQQSAIDMFLDGASIKLVCADLGISRHTMLKWRVMPAFAAAFTRARQLSFDIEADEMQEAADTATNATVNVVRLQVDTKKWRLSKLHPSVYGDKIEHTVNGHIDVIGALAEGQQRLEQLRASRVRGEIIDGEYTEETTGCDAGSGDNVSPAALSAPDGL